MCPKYTSSVSPLDPLEDLKDRPQWVAWKKQPNRKNPEKIDKVPYDPHTRGTWARTNAPKTWGTYQRALACARKHGYSGIGFMLTAVDPYFMLDLDKCRDPKTGVIHPAALKIIEEFGSYTEISPSGTGIRIIGLGTKPGPLCVSKDIAWDGQIEIYDRKHFCTISENTVGEGGSFLRDCESALDTLYRNLWPEPEKPVQAPQRNGTGHTPALDRERLLHKARNGPHGREFSALYDHGDISVCRNDASRADLALCKQLAFWTGGDAALMDSLFRQSALYRKKWEREDYRNRTIENAIKRSKRYDPEHKHRVEGSTLTRDKLLEIHRYAMFGYEWADAAGGAQKAQKGTRARAALKVMLRAAWKANSLEIGMSEREMMVAAGFGSRRTAAKALASLQDTHGWVVKINDGGPGKSARYRLTPPAHPILGQSKIEAPSIVDQSQIEEHFSSNTPPLWIYETGPLLSKLVEIRNTSPTSDKEYDKNGRRRPQGKAAPVASVGKVAAWVLDLVHYYSRITGKPAPVGFLEERTGVRRDNLKSREIRKLLDAGLILEVEGGYTTPEDVEERLERELEISGCNEKKRIQTAIIAREREIMNIHRMRKAGAGFDRIAELTGRSVAEIMDILKIADAGPSFAHLDQLKERREERTEIEEIEETRKNADGDVNELEKEDEFGGFSDPESPQQPLGHEYASQAEPQESRPSAPGEVSKTKPPHEEPQESNLSHSGKVSKGNVPPPSPEPDTDAHEDNCLCEDCTDAVDMHRYASLVT